MARKYNKKLQRRNNQRYKKGFNKAGKTNKLYHSSIPRTLQVATRRYNSQMLRFVKNLVYEVNPQTLSENIFLSIRANSIYDILQNNGSQNQPGTWLPQDDVEYPVTAGHIVNADGWDAWRERFQHFTVIGSKLQVTYQPTQLSVVDTAGTANGTVAQAPSTLYITLSGVANQISNTTAMRAIVNLPYLKRGAIHSNVQGQNGKRLYSFYSAKKFEGVKDVIDNQQLRGRFLNSFGSANQVSEQSFFNVGICPTVENTLGGSSDKKPPGGIIMLKVEYIVKLTEPTDTNQVSA